MRILSLGRRSGPICSVSAKGASSNQPGAKPQVRNRKTKMRAESPRQKHHIAAPHTYLSNAMKRAVGALERTGSQFLGPCPRLISNGPLALSSPPGHTISLSPTFNHTPAGSAWKDFLLKLVTLCIVRRGQGPYLSVRSLKQNRRRHSLVRAASEDRTVATGQQM